MAENKLATTEPTVAAIVKRQMPNYVKALPGGNERALARFQQAAMGIAMSPGMRDCVPETVAKAIYECARLNLIPDPVMREVFLVPFASKKHGGRKIATLIIGYPGILKLARNAEPRLTIRTGCVFETDDYILEEGLTQTFKIHKQWWQKGQTIENRGKVVFAYCIHKMPGQEPQVKFVPHADLMKLANASRAGYKPGTPWHDHFDSMGEKTAILRSKKTWTLDPDRNESRIFNEAISMDEADPDSGNSYIDSDDVFGDGFGGEDKTAPPSPEAGDRPVGQAGKTTVSVPNKVVDKPAEVKTPPTEPAKTPGNAPPPAAAASNPSVTSTDASKATTTAKTGVPGEASRGAAVERSKKELGALLDQKCEEAGAAICNANQWLIMMSVSGLSSDDLGPAVKTATLDTLTKWKTAIGKLTKEQILAMEGVELPPPAPAEEKQEETATEGDGSAEDGASEGEQQQEDETVTVVEGDGSNVTTAMVVEAWAGIRDISESKAGAALKKLCKLRYEGKTVESLTPDVRKKLMEQISSGELKFSLFE